MSSRLSLPALYIDSSCGMSYCGLPPPKMVPCRFFCIRVSIARFSVDVGVHQAADGGQHAGAALGGQVQVVVDVLAVQLADGDDDLVGHQAVGDLGDARHRGDDVGVDVGGTELQRLVALPLDRVDREDVAGAGVDRTLQRRHADAADADDRDVLARPDVGGADRRAVAGGDAAADQAATSNGIDGSIFTTELLCTTMYGRNVPSSVIGKTCWPVAWMRKVPSETAAPPSRPAPRSHRLRMPA